MYTSKKFSIKPEQEIAKEIRESAILYPQVRKIFLADGNAMVLSTSRLLRILEMINAKFKRITRISAYASPRDMENKPVEDLKKIREAGLKLIYVGIESGDDELLRLINKGENSESIKKNLQKAKNAGIKTSVMILTGLGGKKYSSAHARNSASLVSQIQPNYLSTLVLSFPYGSKHYETRFAGEFVEMDSGDLLSELYQFIEATHMNDVVFRSDHASNYLALKGVLGRDKKKMLHLISEVIDHPNSGVLRQEWERGL